MRKPNIINILIDDMGWKDLCCAGSSFYETPNIDRLCREGMRFDQAYAACPVCSPTRASLMSGKYPARLGATDWFDMQGVCHPIKGRLIDAPYVKHLPDGEVTVAQSLKDAGYATWHVGKWHLGAKEYYPERFGFDKNIGGCDWGHPHKGYFSPYYIETLEDRAEGEYLTDRITDEAIALIRQGSEKPFFLNLCHYTVHTPIQAKEEDIAKFQKKAADMGLDKIEALQPGEFFSTVRQKNKRVMRRMVQSDPVYAAMIWNLDLNIGRLIAALEETSIIDDTVILFTSDNGGLSTAESSPTCNLPASEGKGWLYEGGLRVPLIIRYPSLIKAGSICDTPVTTTDIYPTYLDLAGEPLRPHQHCDGVSMMPLFKRNAMPDRPIFWHYPHYGNQGGTPGAAVRMGRYKLIHFFEDDRRELYDLEADLEENTNIAATLPQKADELADLLKNWQDEVCAVFPATNTQWPEE